MVTNQRVFLEKMHYALGWAFFYMVTRHYINYIIKGEENLPEEASILVANHACPIDGILISSKLHKQVHFFVQYENIYNTTMGKLLNIAGEIFVKTDGRDKAGIKKAVQYLKKTKDYVAIFPEGPTKDLYKERSYSGSVFLSNMTGKKIIPIGISIPEKDSDFLNEIGGLNSLSLTKFIKEYYKRDKIEKLDYYINIGQPVSVSINEENKEKRKMKLEEITDYLINECYMLSKEVTYKQDKYV